MFIKNIPLSHVKSAAATAVLMWGRVRPAIVDGDLNEALKHANGAYDHMRKNGRICAASMLAAQTVNILSDLAASKKPVHEIPYPKDLVLAVVDAVYDELARLSNGKIRSSLHLAVPSNNLRVALGKAAFISYKFFLPVEPLATHRSTLSDMGSVLPYEQAMKNYIVQVRALSKQIVEFRNLDKLREFAEIAGAIHRRTPPSQASIICEGISVWAHAIHAGLKNPNQAQWGGIVTTCSAFESWLLRSMQGDKCILPLDGNFLSFVLYHILTCKNSKRAAAFIAEYGLDDIASKDEPEDLAIPFAVIESGWQKMKICWEEFVGNSNHDTLARVHASISTFAKELTTTSSGYQFPKMVEELSTLIGKEPSISVEICSKVSSALAQVLEILTTAIEDRNAGLRAAEEFVDNLRHQGIVQTSIMSSASLPSSALLQEIAVDIGNAASRCDFGDLDGVEKNIGTAVMAASFLEGKVSGIEAFGPLAKKVGGIKKEAWPDIDYAYSQLVRALELFAQEPSAAVDVLQKVSDAVDAFESRQKAALSGTGMPIDIRGDAEIFEIFSLEVEEVYERIISILDTVARVGAFDKDNSPDFRRAFHTLKGSSRMAGLNHLGEVGWSMEQMINKFIAEGHIPVEVSSVARFTADLFKECIERIAAKGSSPVNVNEVKRQIAELLESLEGERVKNGLQQAQAAVAAVAPVAEELELPAPPAEIHVDSDLVGHDHGHTAVSDADHREAEITDVGAVATPAVHAEQALIPVHAQAIRVQFSVAQKMVEDAAMCYLNLLQIVEKFDIDELEMSSSTLTTLKSLAAEIERVKVSMETSTSMKTEAAA